MTSHYTLAPPGHTGTARVKIQAVLDDIMGGPGWEQKRGPTTHHRVNPGPKPGSHREHRHNDPTSKERCRPPRPRPTPC